MELRQINTFIRVAQLKSFSKAAESLGYSQSAVTVQIQQLEKDLHIRLFDRMGKRVSLTAPGTQFLEQAYNVLNEVNKARLFMSDTGELHGQFDLTTDLGTLYANTQLGIFSGALLGGLLAFLLFNAHPAKTFMGDTGSLFLGGAVAGLAFAFDMPLVLIFVGIVYIIETLSDILQVTYFKLTHGKRIFKMAPIHHHFEMCGWSEVKIVTVFTAVSIVFCALALFGVMDRPAP